MIANFLSVKIILHCFLLLFVFFVFRFYYLLSSSCLCFLWFESYFVVISHLAQYPMIIYYCFYTISFIRFSAFINHIYAVYCTEVSGFFIFTFMSLYSLNALLTETNLSWLIYESIKSLENKSLIVSNFVFTSNTILSYLFFFFIIDICFWFMQWCTNLYSYRRTRYAYKNSN